jgi:hypothetical protein
MNSAEATITAVRRVWRETLVERMVGETGMPPVSRDSGWQESPARLRRLPRRCSRGAEANILTRRVCYGSRHILVCGGNSLLGISCDDEAKPGARALVTPD